MKDKTITEHTITYRNKNITYLIKRTRRKTIGLKVDPMGITVSAPMHARTSDIQKVVHDKLEWIFNAIIKVEAGKRFIDQRTFLSGDTFLFLGDEYQLCVQNEKSILSLAPKELPFTKISGIHAPDEMVTLDRNHMKMIVTVPVDNEEKTIAFVKAVLKKWYLDRAKECLTERLEFYSHQLNVVPQKLVIKDQKTRWGSCSTKRNININWRIIMAPLAVIDYLVIHELAHMIEMNHSDRFWHQVYKIQPDFKKHREWLKRNGKKLVFD